MIRPYPSAYLLVPLMVACLGFTAAPVHAADWMMGLDGWAVLWVRAAADGEWQAAREVVDEACAGRSGRWRASCLVEFGVLEYAAGRVAEARGLFDTGRELLRRQEDAVGLCVVDSIEHDLEHVLPRGFPPRVELDLDPCLRLRPVESEASGPSRTRLVSPDPHVWRGEELSLLPPDGIPRRLVIGQTWNPGGMYPTVLWDVGSALLYLGRLDAARPFLRHLVELGERFERLDREVRRAERESGESRPRGVGPPPMSLRHAYELLCALDLFQASDRRASDACLQVVKADHPGISHREARRRVRVLGALADGDLGDFGALIEGLKREGSTEGDPWTDAWLSMQMALGTGRYEEALRRGLRLLPEALELGDREAEVEIRRIVGSAYESLGLPEHALEHLEAAERAAVETGPRDLVSEMKIARAELQAGLGRTPEARELCRQVELWWLGSLGGKAQAEAARCFDRVEAAERRWPSPPPFLRNHWTGEFVGWMDRGFDLFPRAPERAEEAFARAQAVVSGLDVAGDALLAMPLLARAVVRIQAGEEDAAEALLDRVTRLEGLDAYRHGLGGIGPLAALRQQVGRLDQVLAGAYFRVGATAKFLQHSERSRARTFLQGLGAGWLESSLGARGGELEELGERCAELAGRALVRGDGDGEVWQELEECQRRYRRRVAEIAAEQPMRAGAAGLRRTSLEALQRQLAVEGLSLVLYFRAFDRYLALVVTGEDVHTFVVETGADRIDDQVRHLRTLIVSRSAGESHEVARDLYDALWEPVAGSLGSERVVLVPHRGLHGLPFAALRAPDGSWLVESRALSYTPSTSAFAALRSDGTPSGDATRNALLLGDPAGSLPGAARAVPEIARLWQEPARVGKAATEARVRTEPVPRVLHLSAHGFLDAGHPFASHVRLAPDEEHDGRLELREILSLDLAGTDLVVLATCRSAEGERSAGDDVGSLTRAFLTAGARSVLSTDWRVDDDATARLMVEFHRRVRRGSPVDEALRGAQIELLEDPERSEPFYWAAFGLHGAVGSGVGAERPP